MTSCSVQGIVAVRVGQPCGIYPTARIPVSVDDLSETLGHLNIGDKGPIIFERLVKVG
jgi:hypothetical protein